MLGLGVLIVRRHVPESPRWLFIHGREEEAEAIVRRHRDALWRSETDGRLEEPDQTITVRQREKIPFREIAKTAFQRYPRRAVLGLALFIGQAFLYNGVTFNLGTLYSTFWSVSSSFVPVFLIVFAVGNFLGPLLLGRLFDTVGRKPMIAGTYLGSAAIAALMALLFTGKALGSSPWTFEAFIFGTFFLASAGASCRLPDGERDLPDGDARAGDRLLLRGRHRHRRHHRAAPLLEPHRVDQPRRRRDRRSTSARR